MKDWWLWIRILLVFGFYVVFGVLPALSVIPVSSVPPLADMQVTEGTISTRAVTKAGQRTMLTNSDGRKEVFSCRDNVLGTHTCMHPRYAGEFGQIHWFWAQMPVGDRYKFADQIAVNGVVVRDRSTVIEELEESRVVLRFVYAPLAFIGFVAIVFLMAVPKGITTDRVVNE